MDTLTASGSLADPVDFFGRFYRSFCSTASLVSRLADSLAEVTPPPLHQVAAGRSANQTPLSSFYAKGTYPRFFSLPID